MNYILTCGCESKYGGFPSEWDGESRECEPAVFYGCLCDKHFSEYDARPAQYQDKEDKLGTLEEAIEFDKKRNYQYTAPRELSDEEIREVAKKHLGHSMGLLNWHSFARAILKKASEK